MSFTFPQPFEEVIPEKENGMISGSELFSSHLSAVPEMELERLGGYAQLTPWVEMPVYKQLPWREM